MHRAFPTENEAGCAQRNLRFNIGTVSHRVLGHLQKRAPAVFVHRILQQRISDRQAGFLRHFGHPAKLFFGRIEVGSHFKHAMTAALHAIGNAQKFVLIGEGAGHGFAVFRQMQHGARGGKAERTCFDAVFNNIGHFFDIFGRCRFIIGTALAHHISAHGAMRNLCRDIQRARHFIQRVQIFGEGFPLPVNAFSQRRARNILNPFHQINEPIMLVGFGRCEADAAIAHNGGGDTVPARRAEIGVPGHLPVIMGVNINPAGGDQITFGINFSLGFGVNRPDFRDFTALHGNIGLPRRRTRAVYQFGISNNKVKHVRLPKPTIVCTLKQS